MKTTKRLKLLPLQNENMSVNDIYRFIRNEQYQQYLALNLGMTLLHTHFILSSFHSGAEAKINSQIHKCKTQIEKVENKLSSQNIKEATRVKNEELLKNLQIDLDKLYEKLEDTTNTRSDIDIQFNNLYIKNIYSVLQTKVYFELKDNMSLVTQRVFKDFKADLKNGLMAGKRVCRSYESYIPLMVRGANYKSGRGIRLFYDEENDSFFIEWAKGIKFKVILGRNDKDSLELKHALHLICRSKDINNGYKICDSSMFIKDKKLLLNMCVDINLNNKVKFIEDRVVGVDLGLVYPAYVSLNDNNYIRKPIGYERHLIDTTIQFKARLKRLQKEISFAGGGRGRKDKLQALNRLKNKEANFRRTFQHKISKQIVDFAVKNQAQYINLEFLSLKDSNNSFILQSWGYYQLQQMIEYKAERVGIKVRYVDPYLTSQTCSKCGHYEEGQRQTQSEFECKKCGLKCNADYNASQNIANSTKFIASKEEGEYYKLFEKNKDIDD